VAISITMFRLFTPWEVFPVVYRKGSTAHLDVTGRRGEAIRRAAFDQLGVRVIEIKPFGLEGSGGSTPLRLRIEGNPDAYVFAKLYAKSHVRADRWYKLWRTIVYGSLEDEASFQTVRRFVEYEDYALRLIYDAGIPTAEPHGIVEITPEAEYMLVMGFQQGAVEIGEAEVDDSIIDQGLGIVRRLWDAGLAHRDIKPANLLVNDGRLILIDVFFVQVRPSPWRQAVDLANMMLVLAVRTDPGRVYERALRLFTPDEIAEAFAATRGVASPTQLRAFMKRDPRDLLTRFRELAPYRDPIRIQRLSVRRVLIGLGMLVVFLIGIQTGIGAFIPLQDLPVSAPECGTGNAVILITQSVPRSTMIPCLASLPTGWTLGGAQVHSNRARFWLDSDRAGRHAVQVTLTPSCVADRRDQVPTDEPGTQRYEEPSQLRPRLIDRRVYLFGGGCVTYDFNFSPGAPSPLVFAVDTAVSFERRGTLVSYLRRSQHAELCGAAGRCRG
jgi:tRNA A-37 threonylcarbamoyl transferase component Bud32